MRFVCTLITSLSWYHLLKMCHVFKGGHRYYAVCKVLNIDGLLFFPARSMWSFKLCMRIVSIWLNQFMWFLMRLTHFHKFFKSQSCGYCWGLVFVVCLFVFFFFLGGGKKGSLESLLSYFDDLQINWYLNLKCTTWPILVSWFCIHVLTITLVCVCMCRWRFPHILLA